MLASIIAAIIRSLPYWHAGQFALRHFNTVLKYRPGDGPSQVLAARCRGFMAQPPPDTWNLIWECHEK